MPRSRSTILVGLIALGACRSVASPAAAVRDLIAADNRSDLDAVLASYTDDVVWRPTDRPSIVGKEAIRLRYEELFRTFEPAMRVEIEQQWCDATTAVVRGLTSGELHPKSGGAPTPVDDRFTARLRWDAGAWRVCELSWGPRRVDRVPADRGR